MPVLSFLEWTLLTVAFYATVTLFFLIKERRARLKLEYKFKAMELVFKNSRQQHDALARQFNELRVGSLGMGKKMVELSDKFDALLEKQNQLEMHDSEGKLYSRASKMVELGADVDELMMECELPKAEAELLLNIRKHISIQ